MNYLQKFQQENGLVADGILGKNTLLKMKEVFKIKSDNRLVMFLGQLAHESGNFQFGIENLNYSRESLLKVFGKYFNSSNVNNYARNPEKIANRVYANRMGNGNEASGDGWKHRGAGVIQLTGKTNQLKFSKFLGVNVVGKPEIIASKYYWETGLFFFQDNDLWGLGDNVTLANIKALTLKINGGYNGLEDRIERTNYFKKLLS